MNSTADKVLAETIRFREALPTLVEQYRGKWVVFMGGEVKSVHPDEHVAYEWAVQHLGTGAGYVIAPVVEAKPTPVTAGVLFGLAPV